MGRGKRNLVSRRRQDKSSFEKRGNQTEVVCHSLADKMVWEKTNGKLHREDGPAVIHNNPKKALGWYLNGQRLGLEKWGQKTKFTGCIDCVHFKLWLQDGLIHRLNGPAIEAINGREEWYIRGVKHREKDQPAVIDPAKNLKEWYIEGRLSRSKGPAIIEGSRMEWYIWGGRMSIISWGEDMRTGERDVDGRKNYEGNIVYWHKRKLHNENGPAIRYKNGDKSWYYNGRLHRLNGPALIGKWGIRWFIDGKELDVADWGKKTQFSGKTYCNNGSIYFRDGLLHRLNGPAVQREDDEQWWFEGKRCKDAADLLVLKSLNKPFRPKQRNRRSSLAG